MGNHVLMPTVRSPLEFTAALFHEMKTCLSLLMMVMDFFLIRKKKINACKHPYHFTNPTLNLSNHCWFCV